MSTDYQHLIEKLDGFIRKYYKDQVIRGALYTIGLLGLLFLGMTLFEHFGHFGTEARTGLFWGYVLGASFVLVRFIAIPLVKLLRLGKTIDHSQAATIIGKHFAEVKDKLLNTLQLQKQASERPEQQDWIEASIAQRSRALSVVPFAGAIDLRKNTKYLRYALPPLVVLLALLFIAPNIITESTGRLLAHNKEFIPEAPFNFLLNNEELLVPEGEDFQLELEMEGDVVPGRVGLLVDGKTVPMVREDNVHFTHRFRNVLGEQQFQFEADGFRSQYYTLKTVPNPLLIDLSLSLDIPDYLGRKDEVIQNAGDVTVPAGTHITWKAQTRSADLLELAFEDTTYSLSPSAPDRFQADRRFLNSKSYTVAPRNQHITPADPLRYRIEVIPDLYPTIESSERIDSTAQRHRYFRGRVNDDHGFKRLAFHYKVVAGGDSIVPELRSGTVALNIDRGATQQDFYHLWDLYQLNIQPGDRIEHWFEVWDNDGVNGSKSARTRIQTFEAPTLKDLAQQKEENSEELKEGMEESIDEAKKLQEDLDKLRREMMDKKELGWQEKKKLEDLMERQQQLQQNVEQMSEDLRESHKQQSEFRQLDEQILQKQEQLQKLFDEVLSEEMKEMYKEMQELMEKLDKEAIQEQLEAMEMSQEDIEKELDRSLELFKQMEVEQGLEDVAEQLNELAEEQKELAEETEKGEKSAEELAKEQEELNKKFDDIQKQIDDLEKKNEELENKVDIPDTEKEQEDIDKEMQESSDDLQKKDEKKASESQKDAAEQMEQLAFQMESASGANGQEKLEEDMDALRQLLENIVQLSFDQEQVMDELATLKARDPRYVDVGRDQKDLRNDARMIEDSLFALSKRVPQLESMVNREMNLVNSNIDKATELISEARTNERLRPQAAEKQQRAMTSLNNLALLLDEAMQQMMQQMQSMMPGTGQCDKPGGKGQGKPSAKKMRAMQEQLEKQLAEMMKQMGKGKKPGEKGEGEGGMMPGMSQGLAKMAAQQAAIRKEVQRLAQEMNKDGSGGGNGLNSLAEQMEEIEKDIVKKKIDQQTLDRQKDIVTRLLEHEKAEREREYDNKRTSNEGRDIPAEDPARFFQYQQEKQREAELLRTVPPGLKPYYKERVNDYFGKFGQP